MQLVNNDDIIKEDIFMKKNILFIVVLIGLLSNTIFAMTPTWPNDAKFNRSVSNAYY